ncbi:MAG: CBS domain-containing protein [Myxococcaceae bacterium]|nr:CBS domain-containing protein [Myxococcaceae bacterium]
MRWVSEVMAKHLEAVDLDDPVQEAAERMRSCGIGALAVLEDGKLVGIVTDRDITVRITARGRSPGDAPVRDAMTAPVVTCREDDPLTEAERLMEEHAVRRLVVVNAWHQPVGLISLDDLATIPGERVHASEVLSELNIP